MTPWIPCYPLTSAGIFKSSSWPPSVVTALKRHTGKNVRLLQIPPAGPDFAVSAPLIYGASGTWGDQRHKAMANHLLRWPKGKERVRWLARVVRKGNWNFCWWFGEREKENGVVSTMEEEFENLLLVELLFSSEGQKSQLGHAAKEAAQLQQGEPSHAIQTESKKRAEMERTFFPSPSSVQMEGE